MHSINLTCSVPVSISALNIDQIYKLCRFKRCGLTPFTFSRFLVPYLCNFEGWALFLDADILVKGDINELFNLADDKYAVMVSKNEHRFEWASVMLFNNAKCQMLTPEFVGVESAEKQIDLHGIKFVSDELVGDLPREWNHLVGYDKQRSDAKLIHFTQASPANIEGAVCEYSVQWQNVNRSMNSTASWLELMGNSRHAKMVNDELVPIYLKGDDLENFIDYRKNPTKENLQTYLTGKKRKSIIEVCL